MNDVCWCKSEKADFKKIHFCHPIFLNPLLQRKWQWPLEPPYLPRPPPPPPRVYFCPLPYFPQPFWWSLSYRQPVKFPFWIRTMSNAAVSIWTAVPFIQPALLHPHYTALSASFIHIMSQTILQFSLQFTLHFSSVCVVCVYYLWLSYFGLVCVWPCIMRHRLHTGLQELRTTVTLSWTEMEKHLKANRLSWRGYSSKTLRNTSK